MSNILRSDPDATFQKGPFHIRHVRPGHALPAQHDTAFGSLSGIDHADLGTGTLVSMHEHKNDEILSYLMHGTMIHEDRNGQRVALSSQKIMMMNAGESFWHEESAPSEPVEMLQIFIRPREADLEGRVQFLERKKGENLNHWELIAAPEGQGECLEIRQQIYVCDIQLLPDQKTEVPVRQGFATFLYVAEGAIGAGDSRLGKGDGLGSETDLPEITALAPSVLVCFQVKLNAEAVMVGSISGK